MSDADKLKYLDEVPSRYRHARAIGLAVVVLMAIAAVLSLRCNPLVGREKMLGLCLAVEAEKAGAGQNGEPLARIVVAVPDSNEVRLLAPPPVPRPGDFLPLIAERHKKGNVDYFIDEVTWRAHGPQ